MTSPIRASVHILAAALLAAAVGRVPAAQAAVDSPPSALSPQPGTYNLSYDQARSGDDFSVFHMSLADRFGVLSSAMMASEDPRLRPVTRLDSFFTFNAPLVHAPARIGDTVSSSGFWEQPLRMGGLQVGTIAPSLPDVVSPSLLFAPDVLNAPGAASMTSNRFIDHVNTVAQLQTQSLQGVGRADYSVEMGRIRQDFELRSNTYGAWLATGTYRYGVTSGTTLDGQFAQLGAQQSVLGVGVLKGLGVLGQASARVASSRDASGNGWLARMGYDFTHDSLNLALRTHLQSQNYQTIDDVAAVEPLRARTLASAGWNTGSLGTFSVASATQTYVDESRRDVLALSHAVTIAGGGILSTAAAYSPGQIVGSAVMVSVYFPFNYWMAPVRTVARQIDVALDKTIDGALNTSRLPLSGRVMPGLLVQ